MPGREDEDAGEVVVVPGHLFLAEEADDLLGRGVGCEGAWRRRVHEEVVVEGGNVEEDGFVVEEEFREEGEVLREELVLLPVDFVDAVVGLAVDQLAKRLFLLRAEFDVR